MNLKTYKEYQKAFSEINFILDNSETNITNKIPKKFIDLIKNNMDKNYVVKIDLSNGIENSVLLDKTKDILSLIYRDYICSKEEREELIDLWEAKKQTINTNQILQNNSYEKREIKIIEDKKIAKIENKKWYEKIINKIRNI